MSDFAVDQERDQRGFPSRPPLPPAPLAVCDACFQLVSLDDTTVWLGQDTRTEYRYCGTCTSKWHDASPLEQRYLDGDR